MEEGLSEKWKEIGQSWRGQERKKGLVTVYGIRILVAKITRHTMSQPRAGVWLSIQSTIPQSHKKNLSSFLPWDLLIQRKIPRI